MGDTGPAPDRPERIEIPDYEVGEAIGRGGFGTVYRARHVVLGRDVAIKVLHAEYSRDPAAVARFVAEARAVNTIDHPAIVDVFDFGQLADGRQYYVMELIRGRTLRDVLRERGRLPLAEALPLLRAIAGAVDAAHVAGIAHRDLKPDNVFVLPVDRVKLIDFGLAKLTRAEEVPVTETGAVFGSPHYMSPEQCRGKAVALSTDAYSFGVLAYQVLTGELPFRGDALAVALQHLNDPPAPPSLHCPALPPRVDAATLALLAKEPAARPMPLAAAVERMTGSAARVSRIPPWMRILGTSSALGFAVLTIVTGIFIIAARSSSPSVVPAATQLTWRGRHLPVRQDGLSAEPSFTRDGAAFTYSDRTATWRYDLATGARSLHVPDRLRKGNAVGLELPDGRWVLGRHHPGPGDTHLPFLHVGDAATGEETELFPGHAPSLSPDGMRFAFVQEGWIAVHELRDGSTRRLTETRGAVFGPPRWSRDGAWLVWAAHTEPAADRRVQLTRVADGMTRALPFAIPGDWHLAPAAFLDDGRIVYAVPESSSADARWSLRAHDPASPTADRDATLAELPPSTVIYLLDATAGDRIAVAVRTAAQGAGIIVVDRAVPEEHLLHGDRVELMVAFDPAAHRAYAYASGTVGMSGRVLGDGRPVLVSYDLESLARRDEPVCAGEHGVVWQGDRLGHVELARADGELTIRIRTHVGCALEQAWTMPDGAWAFPRCDARDCFTMRVDGATAEVMRLPAGKPRPVPVARFPAGTANSQPSLALSHDGARLVALAGPGGTVNVVTLRGGATRAYPMSGLVEGVAWSHEPSAFYVHGQFFDETQFAVRRVELDGRMKVIWSSMFRQVFRLYADTSGARLAAQLSSGQSDFWLYEPRRAAP